jgi:hypothetical protein
MGGTNMESMGGTNMESMGGTNLDVESMGGTNLDGWHQHGSMIAAVYRLPPRKPGGR